MFNWVVKGMESGMDNFPRPSGGERVDMTAWMYMAATKMRDMAEVLEFDYDFTFYNSEAQQIKEKLQNFWNNDLGFYVDLDSADKLYNRIGYPGLLPFVFMASSPEKADAVVNDYLTNPSELWTDGGIRSLSKRDRDYEPHYWAGDIWININYLIVKGLEESGYQELAETLKQNILANILLEYLRTGYIWEVYDGNSLKGKYNHCFAGWSALVALMIPPTWSPLDTDGDDLTDLLESTLGTDPNNPDTDGDGLKDGEEVLTFGTNPLEADSDKDGWSDLHDFWPTNAVLPNVFIVAAVVVIGTIGFLLYRKRKKSRSVARRVDDGVV